MATKKHLSPLQQRLENYKPLISHSISGTNTSNNVNGRNENSEESMIRSLCDVAIQLCHSGDYNVAQHVLNDALYGPKKEACYKYSLYWILQSEISEELGNIQDCISFFNTAAKYKSQVLSFIVFVISC